MPPGVPRYVPPGHSAHEVLPGPMAYEPARQVVQFAEAGSAEAEPAAQIRHALLLEAPGEADA